jgi:hypothetical protein
MGRLIFSMWTMPEIKPTFQNTLPKLADKNISNKPTAAPSDIGQSEKPKPIPEAPKKQSNFIFRNLQLGGLILSFPLLFPSLVIQADNITKYGELSKQGLISFISNSIDVLSSPFRFAMHKIFKNDHDENDVSANKRSFVFDDFFQRILHPNFVRETASGLFGVRRALFNFFPKVFITPSEARNPDEDKTNKASKAISNIFYAGSSFVGPFRWISSLATIFTSIPSYLTGAISSYSGDQKLFEISKYFSRISDLFTPITSNLSSLFSSSRALYDSSKGESLKVTFGRYNINFLNVFQGVLGGFLSIPGFFGALSEAKNIIQEKTSHSGKLKIAEFMGEIVAGFLPTFKSYGLFTEFSEGAMKNNVETFIEKTIENSRTSIGIMLDSFYNSTAITKKIASLFRPVDSSGQIINRNDSGYQLETNIRNNVTNSGFSKKMFFNELHSLLHPIQSLIMLLPAAYTPISDRYIADHGKVSIRILDRILGFTSFILSAPNYLIYALSSRVPQIILKTFELKQKRANARGLEYNAYESYKNLVQKIKKLEIPGFYYLYETLNSLPVNKLTFQSNAATNLILDSLELRAQDQEPSNKGTELLETFRIGAKALLARKGLFFAERDEMGYTAEEHSRMNVHKSLGTLKEGIGRIPIVGIFISPIIELLRSRYYVKPRKNLAMPAVQ